MTQPIRKDPKKDVKKAVKKDINNDKDRTIRDKKSDEGAGSFSTTQRAIK